MLLSAEDLAQSEFDTMLKKYNDALTTSAAKPSLKHEPNLQRLDPHDYALDY